MPDSVIELRIPTLNSRSSDHEIKGEIWTHKRYKDCPSLYEFNDQEQQNNINFCSQMFKEKKNSKDIGRDQKILEVYIRGHSPLNIKTDGRIIINSWLI